MAPTIPGVRWLAGVLLLVAPLTAEEWRCSRGDVENTGASKNTGPKKRPEVAWTREEEGPIGTGAALAERKLVYGAGEYAVICCWARDGRDFWKASVKQQVVAWPAVLGDFAFFGGQDTVHYRINMSDGKEPESPLAEGGIVAPAVVTAGHYLAGALDGHFYAIDPASGKRLWRRETGPVRHGAAVDRWRAYVANDQGTLFALDLRDGGETWKHEGGAPPAGPPILAKSVVYLPLRDRVVALGSKKGDERARHDAPGIAGPPVLDKTLLHYGTGKGEIVTLDLKSGKEKARTEVVEEPIRAPLVLAKKILYGAAGKTLFAFDPASRKVLWTFEGEEPFAPPMVADGAVYVGAGNTFYCLR